MAEPLALRLAAHGLDSVAMVIESHASGMRPELCAVKADLHDLQMLLDETKDVVARIETGTLSREEAEALCGREDAYDRDTLRSLPCATIAPPDPTVPCVSLEEAG